MTRHSSNENSSEDTKTKLENSLPNLLTNNYQIDMDVMQVTSDERLVQVKKIGIGIDALFTQRRRKKSQKKR